jgi:SAM-dependent methyltransferase
MINDLVQLHQAGYQEDLPFWTSLAKDRNPILEIGCGHGRVTLPLLREGHEVVGVDKDQEALDFLTKNLEESEPGLKENARVIQVDILQFQPGTEMGAVIVPCNTFSTFQPSDRYLLLGQILNYLQLDGIFAASIPNPFLLQSMYDDLINKNELPDPDLEAIFVHPETGFPVQVSSKISALDGRLCWEWIYDYLHPDGQVERYVRSTFHQLTSVDRYLEELNRVGFSDIRCLGDFQSDQFKEDSPYLILECRKSRT